MHYNMLIQKTVVFTKLYAIFAGQLCPFGVDINFVIRRFECKYRIINPDYSNIIWCIILHWFTFLLYCVFIGRWSPNSDQHQFSPNDIHTLSRDTVMRIDKMITIMKMQTHSVKKFMEVSLENLYVYIKA